MKILSRFLVFTLITLLAIQLRADCLACWQLKHVVITLQNGESIEGYIRWNDIWVEIYSNEDLSSRSLMEKVSQLQLDTEWYDLVVYRDIYFTGDNLPFHTIVASNRIDTIKSDQLRDLSELKMDIQSHEGAGNIMNLEDESIKLIKEKPLYYFKVEGEVSETHYLSYNPLITKEDLILISKDSKYYLKREKYEEQKVIIIVVSWD